MTKSKTIDSQEIIEYLKTKKPTYQFYPVDNLQAIRVENKGKVCYLSFAQPANKNNDYVLKSIFKKLLKHENSMTKPKTIK